MRVLEYSNVTAKITSVTPLSEKHGNKRVPAQSIIIKVMLPNRRLDFFDPDLRHAYYKIPDGKEPAPTLGIDPDDLEGLTEKRFPWMTQDIEVERELTGYVLTIDYGLGDAKSNIELDAKKIDNFKLGVRDHGLFELSHRFIVHPDTMEKGRIEELLQQEIKVHLVAPKVAEQGELLEQAGGKASRKAKKTAAEKIAEEGDPLAGNDLAQDHTRIESTPTGADTSDSDTLADAGESDADSNADPEPQVEPEPVAEKPAKARGKRGAPADKHDGGAWPFPRH